METPHDIHEHIDEWIAAASARGLDEEELGAFNRHLAECPACWDLLTDERRLSFTLENALAGERPGRDFEEKMVMKFRNNLDESSAGPPPRPRRLVLRMVQAAAALLLLACGVFFAAEWDKSQMTAPDVRGFSRSGPFLEKFDADAREDASKSDAEWNTVPSSEEVISRLKKEKGVSSFFDGPYGQRSIPGRSGLGESNKELARRLLEAASGKKAPHPGDTSAKTPAPVADPAKLTSPAAGLTGNLAAKKANCAKGAQKYVGVLVVPNSAKRKSTHTPGGGYIPGEEKPQSEGYAYIEENDFVSVTDDPLSTFSIDVDTASYANVRRFLNHGRLPPADAVRVEEMMNYFRYDYAPPTDGRPFATHMEVCECPWNATHRLVRIGIKGYEMTQDERPSSNLVFLLDVSGSMGRQNKLPLVKQALRLLVGQLGENDRVAIVVYAGASGLALPSTTCDHKEPILSAMDRLHAGGSTNGAAGIALAYQVAVNNFIRGGTNRVILATDGDFNVGVSSRGELVRLIQGNAKSGVFLTVLGFGMGNIKDATLEQLADKGNGNYAYIDNLREAKKVLVEQMGGTLVTIAKDVKIQVEFNPLQVGSYRLVGYENRKMAHSDFHDDRKDAGEIGAGHTVTALYEIVPAMGDSRRPKVDPLRYQGRNAFKNAAFSGELLQLKIRYKHPDGAKSSLLTFTVRDSDKTLSESSRDFCWATAVASFGMLLRDSRHKGNASFGSLLLLAEESVGRDPSGRRAEFVRLVRKAMALAGT
jgi:Ca-activated chloride channel family protein